MDNHGGIPVEIIVIDNASSDGSEALIRDKYTEVEVIRNAENIGFAAACNMGIRKATGEYLLLLNPDTIILPGAINDTIRFIKETPSAGIVGCRLQNQDGQIGETLHAAQV